MPNIELEAKLEQSGALMVQTARGLTITTAEDYERGNCVLQDIKGRMKAVKDYWKEPKKAAQAAHKSLVERESQMLKPLEEAEKIVKGAMLAYNAEVQRKRQEAEEAARKAREDEIRRMEALAAKAEEAGDEDAADVIRDMAEAVPLDVQAEEAPIAKGLSVRKTWKARVVDERLVPAYVNGVQVRSIDLAALNALARYSKGQAEVPGVVFYEESSMVVRS